MADTPGVPTTVTRTTTWTRYECPRCVDLLAYSPILIMQQVDSVACTKGGETNAGSLHLTAHHLIFRRDQGEEMWVSSFCCSDALELNSAQVPYPLISLVTRLPSTLQGQSPLTLRTRTFESFTLSFSSEGDSSDVFESIKELTVAREPLRCSACMR